MHHPQVLVVERDGRLAALLRGVCAERQWLLREPRRLESCLDLLKKNRQAALVVRIGRDLIRELALVDQIAFLFPATALVAVCDADDLWLDDTAWDLGASYVLSSLRAGPLLAPLVEALLAAPHAGAIAPRTPLSEADDLEDP